MKITNKLNLPAGLVKAVSTERHNEPGCISATTLLQGVKHIILTDRHWDELEDDVSDRIWAIWGTAVHSLLEQEGENDFAEQVMSYPVGDITVTGCIDNYDMQNGIICDYKTASVWKVKFNDFEDWYNQGMIYAWLLAKNGFKVKQCRFIALLKDHSKTDAARDYQYPKNPVYVYEFDVTFLNLLRIEKYIKTKIREYVRCTALGDGDIPPCTPDERWDKATKYAVKKEGRKTAIRLLDKQAEAEEMAADLGKGHYVETRPGESTKCLSYCRCCGFCNYYQGCVKAVDEKTEKMAA
ncbi:hypothetical protein AGMMS49546_15810 [Spirochaetia bacterium]|nr:hypothetical protein AGMMS49546_15810 [Spirochaetia bacterium]